MTVRVPTVAPLICMAWIQEAPVISAVPLVQPPVRSHRRMYVVAAPFPSWPLGYCSLLWTVVAHVAWSNLRTPLQTFQNGTPCARSLGPQSSPGVSICWFS